jgi:hypothetical protein
MSQEERSIFWEVIVSVILRKKSLYEHVSYSERVPIFGAQYFPSLPLCEQSQQPNDASHRNTCFRQWHIKAGGKEDIGPQIPARGKIFIAHIPTLGPTQHPIRWCRGVKLTFFWCRGQECVQGETSFDKKFTDVSDCFKLLLLFNPEDGSKSSFEM